MQGGTVSAHSEGNDRGSEFTVRMPAAGTAADGRGAARFDGRITLPILILLMEKLEVLRQPLGQREEAFAAET